MHRIKITPVPAFDWTGKLFTTEAAAAHAALSALAENFVSQDRNNIVKLLVDYAPELTYLLDILGPKEVASEAPEGPARAEYVIDRSGDPEWKVMRDIAGLRMSQKIRNGGKPKDFVRHILADCGVDTLADFYVTTDPVLIGQIVERLGWTLDSLISWENRGKQ